MFLMISWIVSILVIVIFIVFLKLRNIIIVLSEFELDSSDGG